MGEKLVLVKLDQVCDGFQLYFYYKILLFSCIYIYCINFISEIICILLDCDSYRRVEPFRLFNCYTKLPIQSCLSSRLIALLSKAL